MGEIEKGAGGRPGAPWGELKGHTEATNDLARVLRQWLDASGMRVQAFHAKLTPDDFASGRVLSSDTVYSRFAGSNLDWEFISAVVQICSADPGTMNGRLKQAQLLWGKAQAAERARRENQRLARRENLPAVEAPSALAVPDNALPPGQLLIAAYDKIGQMYEARAALTETNHRLELVAVLALGREQDYLRQIADLERRLAAALAAREPDLAQIAAYEATIKDTRAREEEMANARYDAEDDRDIAQQMLSRANQEIADLKAEIDRLKSVFGLTAQKIVERVGDVLGDRLQGVDGAIGAVQQILDEEHDQLHRLRESLGWRLVTDQHTATGAGASADRNERTILGEVVHTADDELPTTPDNSPTSGYQGFVWPENPARRPGNLPHNWPDNLTGGLPTPGTRNPTTPDNPVTTSQSPLLERFDIPIVPDNPLRQDRTLAARQPDNQPALNATQQGRQPATRGDRQTPTFNQRLTRLIGIAITIAWAVVIGSTFTEIRRGPASILSIVLSALAGLLLLGCFQIWIRTVKQHGMTRQSDPFSDSLFIGTTQQKQLQFFVRPPTLFQTIGLLAGIFVPDYLGPLNTIGQGIAHFLGMA